MDIKKIAVFLPIVCHGDHLRRARNIARMLAQVARDHDKPIQMVLSCVKDAYPIEDTFSELIAMGIEIRETIWKPIAKENVLIAQDFSNYHKPLFYSHYQYPDDEVDHFNDCDFWLILLSSAMETPLIPIKPYAVFIFDYFQRYIPSLIDDHQESIFLNNIRNAERVFTPLPIIHTDLLAHGFSETHIQLKPFEYEPIPENTIKIKETPYLHWVIHPTLTTDHTIVCQAFERYYLYLSGTFSIKITEFPSAWFNYSHKNNENTKEIFLNHLIKMNPLLHEKIEYLGNVSPSIYKSISTHAQFLLHTTLLPQNLFSVLDAAYSGVPTLSCDYPHIQFIHHTFSLNTIFFSDKNPKQLAMSLKKMELTSDSLRTLMPAPETFEKQSWKNIAFSFWKIMEPCI